MKSSTSRLPSLISLRASLFAAMGLAACGSEVTVPPGGGGSGGSTSTTSSTSTTTSTALPTECAGAAPIPASDGAPSGFSRCPDGTVHRTEPAACNVASGIKACTGTEMSMSCEEDVDCKDKPHGRCASISYADFGGQTTTCGCVYPCANDAECGAGEVCVCSGVVDAGPSFCAGASCAVGADCLSGECGLGTYDDGCGTQVYAACRSPLDACRTDPQCATGTTNQCALASAQGPWTCLGQNCAIGRPLVVDGEIRSAEPCERADWTLPGVVLGTGGLDAETREQIAEHWTTVGALEHASVASFARFTLELLALGAPAALLAETQRAGFDEVEHARMAYAVASAYAGRKLGPSELDLDHVPVRAEAREIIPSLVAEACVGETLGVAEAIELAGRAREPAMARVYARIAVDEARHAELAWRTLAWMLSAGDDETAALTERCFEETVAAAARDPEPRPLAAPEHGLLPAAQIGALRRRALREVVQPCVAGLLEQARHAKGELGLAAVA